MKYTIVTYCSSGYRDCLLRTIPSWLADAQLDCVVSFKDTPHRLVPFLSERVLEITAFEPGEVEMGEHCCRKAAALRNYVQNSGPGGDAHVALLDCDCYLKRSLGPAFNHDFDVAVTLQSPGRAPLVSATTCGTKAAAMYNNPSAGAVFIRCNDHSRRFLTEWTSVQEVMTSFRQRRSRNRDQAALARACQTLKGSIKLTALNALLFNSYPDSAMHRDVVNWLGALQDRAPATLMLHFAYGLWQNSEFVRDVCEIA